MGREKVKTKDIKGVPHRQCSNPDCRRWIPYFKAEKGPRFRFCKKHAKEYQDKQNEKQRQRRAMTGYERDRYFRKTKLQNDLTPKPEDFTAQNRDAELWPDGTRIELTKDLQIAMLKGDFKTFMRLTDEND